MSSEENEFLSRGYPVVLAAYQSPSSEIDFERALLRKSVGTQAAARPRCRDCGRTPLVGEQMYVYSHGKHVCELCSCLRETAADSSYSVRHGYAGQTVRRLNAKNHSITFSISSSRAYRG